jgi:hypothetical protein
MVRNRFQFFVASVIWLFVISCVEHDGFYSFGKEGVVRGSVRLNASFSHANIPVRMEGANFSRVTLTNEIGDYEFVNVPTSNYEIIFQVPGYGESRVYNIRQSGEDTLFVQGILLYSIPEVAVKSVDEFYAGVNSLDEPFIHFDFLNEPNSADGRIFFSLSPDVSYLDYEVSAHIDRQISVSYQRIFFNEISIQRFRGFKKVYFKIYPNGGGAYFDYSKDLWIHSSVNPELATSTDEFIFPK